jgi:3-oxoacyl-[acyl-carrier protein] reductase
MRLEGKTALVTGGASGFGAGIVRKFLAEGARVAVADINADAANDFATELGENAFAVAVDVSSNSASRRCQIRSRRFGGLDILVNNAGVTHLPARWKRSARKISTGFSRSTPSRFTLPRATLFRS